MVIRSGRLLVDQSTITANTLGGANRTGPGIDFDVRESIVLTQNAAITAASFGPGDAGDIRITAHSLRGTGNAFIGAGTVEDGSAGNIRIDVGTLTLTDRAVIDSSTFGNRAVVASPHHAESPLRGEEQVWDRSAFRRTRLTI